MIDELFHKNKKRQLPSQDETNKLSEEFNNYFSNKIATIRVALDELVDPAPTAEVTPICGVSLEVFNPSSEDEIRKIVQSSPTKTSALDPIPTWIIKQHLTVVLPVLVKVGDCHWRLAFSLQ